MLKKLTPKTIDSLPLPSGKRYEVRDTLLKGLALRVSSTGSKVWYLSTRIEGKTHRIKLGTYPVLSLADAREKAHDVLRQIQMGTYGVREPQRVSLGEIIPQFIELYAKPRNKDWRGTESVLAKFSILADRPLDDIKRSDIVKVLDAMIAGGAPTRANRALAAIKKLFAWCLDRGTIDANPIAALKPPTKEVARDRVLTSAEIVGCWRAAEAESFPFEHFAKLLMLTGQRRGEVAGMRWSEVDLIAATWTIPARRTKNGSQHVVPLAPQAISILESVPQFAGSDFVFTTTGRTAISGFGRLKERLDTASGAGAWRMHDVRRTVATNMAMMGVAPHVIEAVLNHKSGIVSGVSAVYNRHAYTQEKREALQLWAEHVEALNHVDRENQREVLSVAA